MIKCSVMYILPHAVVLKYETSGVINARIIPLDKIPEVASLGHDVWIDEQTLLNGTEYGLDIALLTGKDGLIDYDLLNNALRNRNVWLPGDIKSKSNLVRDALISMIPSMVAKLNRLADLEDMV